MSENRNTFVPPNDPHPSPTRQTSSSTPSPRHSSPVDRFVTSLGHDYNGIQGTPVCRQQYSTNTNAISSPLVSPRLQTDIRPTLPNTNGYPTLSNLQAGQLLQNVAGNRLGGFSGIPPGMMELRSPLGHQPTYLPPHPFPVVGFPSLSPTMAPLESPSPTAHSQLSPGFAFNTLNSFHQQFPQATSPNDTSNKMAEPKDRGGLSWLDAAYKVLEAAQGPLHLEDIKKRILEKDLLKVNARSSLESGLLREIQRGSKRFKRVDSQSGVFRLLTASEIAEQLRRQTEQNSKRAAQMLQKNQETKEKMYEKKYKVLRKSIKMMVFENGALCDAVAECQEKLRRAKAERRFLLNRLLHYMAVSGDRSLLEPNKPRAELTEERKRERNGKRRREKEKHRHKRPKKNFKVLGKQTSDPGPFSKEEERKPSSLLARNYMLQIPLEGTGTPVFPILLSNLKIHSLGYVVHDKPHYHSETHIYTVGFCSSRLYASCQDPNKECWYTCKIMDRGLHPMFEIQSEADDEMNFSADSLNLCHQKLLTMINDKNGSSLVDQTIGRGAEFFGLSHPTVKNLIQNLQNARKCENYAWIKYETVPEKEKRKLEMWCSEDPKISYTALKKREDAKQFQAVAPGRHREPVISLKRIDGMTDSDRLKSILTNHSVNLKKSPRLDVTNVEIEGDNHEDIDVT